MEQSLCSIDVGGADHFVSTQVRNGGGGGKTEFRVTLMEAATLCAWKGTFGGDIRDKAEAIGMEEAEFIDQTKKALTRQSMGQLDFEYQVNSTEEGGKELSWKKVVSSIKFQLGTVTLEPVTSPPDAIKGILLYAIQSIADSKAALYRLETENDRLSNERAQALKRLEKCVKMKEDLEEDLYTKFVVILNEKKAKIRDLNDRGSVDGAGDEGQGQRSHGPADGAIVQEDEEEEEEPMELVDDLDTDEERERDSSGSRKRKEEEALPSATSRAAQDDSIVFEEESHEVPASKARRRRREPQPSRTPSSQKPAIPRVPSRETPSTSSTPSTSRVPSLRKTRSSERSAESDDVDDLLEKM